MTLTSATMPQIEKFTHKKDLPFREYTLVLTPTGAEKDYTWSEIVSFRIALGNDKFRVFMDIRHMEHFKYK